MKQSLGFSNFRELLDRWDNHLEEESKKEKIKNLLNDQNLIFFFKYKGDYFGAPEESRVIFAKMKSPDEDVNKDWLEEANFIAKNISQSIEGEEKESRLTFKDVKDIKILDKEQVEKELMGK